MGLLSNERHRNKLVKLLTKHDLKLAMLMYVSGLVWFLALAYQPLNAGCYFSENALLPGLVESDLPRTLHQIGELRDEVKAEINKDKMKTPQNWVYERFRSLGLDTYRQNFSITYPFKSISSRVVHGENIYAILRARRAASTEALVMCVPLRMVAAKLKSPSAGGIALALALAQEFKLKPYWAKDIVFLFTDYDEIGTLAFLDAYHESSSSECIHSSVLEGRSGPIQAAVNLELPLEKLSYFNLRLEGLNGQLPNLDLVNLVVKLCRKERAQVAVHHVLPPKQFSIYEKPNGESFEEYKSSLHMMLKMMWYQASGAPSVNHGLFHRFHIEALTLQGVKDKKGSRVHDLSNSARIVEGIFRSLNNLQERFHQSFFFYVLPSVDRYVSIGMYMPPFGLMAAAGLLKGLALWVGANREEEEESTKESKGEENKEKTEGGEEKESARDKKVDGTAEDQDLATSIHKPPNDGSGEKEEKDEATNDKDTKEKTDHGSEEGVDEEDDDSLPNSGILTVIPVIFISLLMGWMAYQGPELLTRIMPKFRIQVEDMVIFSMLAIFGAALMYPKLMTRKSQTPNQLVLDWRLLKSIGLICQTLALTSIAITNISQAFFLAALMVPVTTLVAPTNNRLLQWLQMAALVLVSPLCLMLLVGVVSVDPQDSVLDHLSAAFGATKELIFLSFMDTYLFNAWTQAVISAVIFPIWLFFWVIPWATP